MSLFDTNKVSIMFLDYSIERGNMIVLHVGLSADSSYEVEQLITKQQDMHKGFKLQLSWHSRKFRNEILRSEIWETFKLQVPFNFSLKVEIKECF